MLKVLEVAAKYLYVREQPKGSNRAPEIDRWLTALGTPLGSAWCAAFALGCLKEAGDTRKVVRSARVQTMVDGGMLHPASEAVAGDLVVFWFTSLNRYAHIGIVESVTPGIIWTIEANTIPDHATGDTREGYGVFRKRRTIGGGMKVLR